MRKKDNESYCGVDFSWYDAPLRKVKLLDTREGVSCKRCKGSFKSRDVKKKKVHLLVRDTLIDRKLTCCGFLFNSKDMRHVRDYAVTSKLSEVTCKSCIRSKHAYRPACQNILTLPRTTTLDLPSCSSLRINLGNAANSFCRISLNTMRMDPDQYPLILESIAQHLKTLIRK